MNSTINLQNLVLKSQEIKLPASKSLSNRALIIQALNNNILIKNLSTADDTQILHQLLKEIKPDALLDCQHAGTTFRFLTAYLCLQNGTQTLTGSKRMLERPIGPLVDSLRLMGADISYLGHEGYPPLKISSNSLNPPNEIDIAANYSSQFISAIMLIAPILPQPIKLKWNGELVSRPYVTMTAKLMGYFGAKVSISDNYISIEPSAYQDQSYTVESDWSAASYPATWTALSEIGTKIFCPNLFENSLQGDNVLTKLIEKWGVTTTFSKEGAWFCKTDNKIPSVFEYDFLKCPDLAQSFVALCAVNSTTALLKGLKTLRIKETDRIKAMQNELEKVQVFLSKLPDRFGGNTNNEEQFMLDGNFSMPKKLSIATYDDHRMAMAFSLWGFVGSIEIENKNVVSKSYPTFWEQILMFS